MSDELRGVFGGSFQPLQHALGEGGGFKEVVVSRYLVGGCEDGFDVAEVEQAVEDDGCRLEDRVVHQVRVQEEEVGEVVQGEGQREHVDRVGQQVEDGEVVVELQSGFRGFEGLELGEVGLEESLSGRGV